MEIIEYLYDRKKKWIKKIQAFYKTYFTVEGTYTSLLPDKIYIKKLYKMRVGKELDLKNPISFNEKLQWIKLYDRRPEYTLMVDKYAVRDYVKDKIERRGLTCSDIGLNFIPLLGVWDKVEDIDLSSLPNQFVLKPNHCSEVVICRDKLNNAFQCKKGTLKNEEEVRAYLNYRMKQNYYKASREWPYKNVKRKIICEQYVSDDNNLSLLDYKFYCFNGEVKILLVVSGRFHDTRMDYFDRELNHLPFVLGEPHSNSQVLFPKHIKEMIDIAEILSEGIPQVRVDLYYVKEMIFFGEYTFFESGGFGKFIPNKWDEILGQWIQL